MVQPSARFDHRPWPERVGDRLFLLWSTARRAEGLWIGTEEKREAEFVLNRLEEALRLIKSHDRVRFDRIRRDLDRIWVRLLPGAVGKFNVALRACELNRRFVLDEKSSPEAVAGVIVHEATHARLMYCGLGYEECVRERVEKVCIRREIAFAARLPDGRQVSERAANRLAMPREFWSDGERRERFIDSRIKALRDVGAPEWLTRFALTSALLRTAVMRGYAHPETMRRIDDLARFHRARGNLGRARRGFERALAIRERKLGPEHPDTARSFSNLAELCQAEGDLAAAQQHLERAVAIREKTLGSEHTLTMDSLDQLCGLLCRRGKLEGERPRFERAVAIREKVFGPEHIYLAASLSNLGHVAREQGDLVGAHRFFERAFVACDKPGFDEHRNMVAALVNLASLRREQGEFAEAQPLFERALMISEKTLGAEHPDTALILHHLATLLQARADFAGARPLFERALAISEKALGLTHPDTAKIRDDLSDLLKA